MPQDAQNCPRKHDSNYEKHEFSRFGGKLALHIGFTQDAPKYLDLPQKA